MEAEGSRWWQDLLPVELVELIAKHLDDPWDVHRQRKYKEYLEKKLTS
jgi:hypothetical protein